MGRQPLSVIGLLSVLLCSSGCIVIASGKYDRPPGQIRVLDEDWLETAWGKPYKTVVEDDLEVWYYQMDDGGATLCVELIDGEISKFYRDTGS